MIPSTLIREQQTHRHLTKSQHVYQSSSDESWTLITVFSVNQSAPPSVSGCRQRMAEQRSLEDVYVIPTFEVHLQGRAK